MIKYGLALIDHHRLCNERCLRCPLIFGKVFDSQLVCDFSLANLEHEYAKGITRQEIVKHVQGVNN
jgi:hypothetical protein